MYPPLAATWSIETIRLIPAFLILCNCDRAWPYCITDPPGDLMLSTTLSSFDAVNKI